MANRDVTYITPSGDYLEARTLTDRNGIPLDKFDTKPISIKFGDSYSLDSFSRARVSNPESIFANKNIHSRNKDRWQEVAGGVIIAHGAVTGGPFQVGETVTFTPLSYVGAKGVVTAVNAGSIVIDTIYPSDIVVGDTITGLTSGGTATITTTNTGTFISHVPLESSLNLTVGTGATDFAFRQTSRYIPYLPGKSQLITQTFVMGAAKANVVRRVGYFDDDNGLFIEQTGTDIAFVVRTNTSGSPVDTRIPQSSWNGDKLDGTGDSGVTIDLTNMQIFQIDLQWLGGGDVRFMVDIGVPIICHTEPHANLISLPYMKTASLPVRYEIRNTGVTASNTSMYEVCCDVCSEGGYQPLGSEYSTPITWASERAVTTRVPILAIRLKNQVSASVTKNRKTVILTGSGFYARTNDALFEVVHVHGVNTITATWNPVSDSSVVEYSTDISALTAMDMHIIDHGISPAGLATTGSTSTATPEKFNEHSFITQNHDSTSSQMFVIYATSRVTTSNATSYMSWIEYE